MASLLRWADLHEDFRIALPSRAAVTGTQQRQISEENFLQNFWRRLGALHDPGFVTGAPLGLLPRPQRVLSGLTAPARPVVIRACRCGTQIILPPTSGDVAPLGPRRRLR
jgi:hypothetical protein